MKFTVTMLIGLVLVGAPAIQAQRIQVPTKPASIGGFVTIDSSGPAKVYMTSCTANPTSVVGQIPAGTRVRVVDTAGCDSITERGPDGNKRTARLAYTLIYYKVEWNGEAVWISSGATRK